ncbi:MAG TPA: transglutaminase-like domain-containing protein [Armatimonadota bacterium]|nr:transglutaminase-like domain-containing protein [Armatimonadota bacterium]
MESAEARRELRRLLDESPEPFPFDRAALLLAADADPSLDVRPYEACLDRYAERVGEAAGAGEPDPRRRLGALRRVVFEDEGFHGNRDDYYDVRNSYLNEVLDRKLGIPISLATVVLGVARRLGWPLHPVNFPQHFLLRYATPDEPLAVDAFHGGLILGADELEERWRFATGYDAPDASRMLEPAAPVGVLVRMLNNIRGIHHQQQDYRGAARATELIGLIDPLNPQHERDLGYFLLKARELEPGITHLERYLERAPHAVDADVVREYLASLRGPRRPPEA